MEFIEIIIAEIDGEAAEAVSELFNRYGYGGAVVETYPPNFDRVTVRTVIPSEDDYRLRQIEVMLTLIGQALPKGLPHPKTQFVGESDWANSWREHFHVVRVGRQFVIKPSWRDHIPAAEDIVIEIDPGLAFGSGLHPTTQLCLQILEELPLRQKSFFDVGTGSAILTIAALKLGARPVRAVDIDAVAIQVARENLERNGYPPLTSQQGIVSPVEVAVGSAADAAHRRWHVIVANILAHILIEIMSDLAVSLAPNGHLILSGIILEQEAEIMNCLSKHHLRLIDRRIEGDWVALIVGNGKNSQIM